MSLHIQTECDVSGPLCFILRISRVAGAAPLNFEKESNGRVHVSRRCDIYGKILIIFVVALCSISLVTDEKSDDFSLKIPKNRIIWTTDIVSAFILSLTVTFTGFNRMRCLVHCLAQLKQITQDTKDFGQVMSSGRNNMIICTLMLILLCLTIGIDYSSIIHDIIINNGGTLSSFYIVFFVCVLSVLLYVLQFYLIVLSVLQILQVLNKHLRTSLQPVSDNNEENTTAVTIRRLGLLYCSLCEIIRMLNDSNGLTLVVLFASTVLHLIMSLYYFIDGVFHGTESRDVLITFKQSLRTFFHCAELLLITEPCHRTHEEMDLTKDLLNRIKQSTTSEDVAIMKELKAFSRHLVLNQVTYSPLDLFTINRPLLTAILSNIITYFIIMVGL